MCSKFSMRPRCPAHELCIQKKSDTVRVSSCLTGSHICFAKPQVSILQKLELQQPYAAERCHKNRHEESRNRDTTAFQKLQQRAEIQNGQKSSEGSHCSFSKSAFVDSKHANNIIFVMLMVTNKEDFSEPQSIAAETDSNSNLR